MYNKMIISLALRPFKRLIHKKLMFLIKLIFIEKYDLGLLKNNAILSLIFFIKTKIL